MLRASYGASTPVSSVRKSGGTEHTLNVLVVRNLGSYYERIAVGKMYSDRWNLAGQKPQKKAIVLA
jgi:hypothetical protein